MSGASVTAFVDAIGLISDIIGLASFATSNFAPVQAQGATIQIKAGLQCPDVCEQFGGEITRIEGSDTFNTVIGTANGGGVSDGGILEVTLDQETPGQQVDFLSVSNSNDATCISWISLRNFDDVEAAAGAWNGDIGRSCGQAWYYGNQIAGTFKDGGGEWRPACTWLDGDATNGINSASLKFRVNAYGGLGARDAVAAGDICASTIFSPSGDPITDQPAKRQDATTPEFIETELIISQNIPQHNATELCQDGVSWGPDFVGVDGFLCSMSTRELTVLCSVDAVDGCVDIDETAAVVTKRTNIAKREAAVHKQYKTVVTWS